MLVRDGGFDRQRREVIPVVCDSHAHRSLKVGRKRSGPNRAHCVACNRDCFCHCDHRWRRPVVSPLNRRRWAIRKISKTHRRLAQGQCGTRALLVSFRSEGPNVRRAQCPPGQSYSITSSARASSCGGTVRPSAFAVFRLMVSSNLVGCITGKSAGFSPLRMRLT